MTKRNLQKKIKATKVVGSVCCIALLTVFGTTPRPAQAKQESAKPDFTGTWLLDPKRSNVGPSAIPDKPLKIAHHDPELRITHAVASNGQKDFVYYTDGRGETNATTMFLSTGTDMKLPGAKDVTKSTTKWSGNKLVTRVKLRSVIGGHSLEFEIIDEWKLAKDGQTLSQTSRTVFSQDMSGGVFVPANRPDFKRVYNRVPD
ncbi:MAG TPA: hypothetical protein DC047_04170 [Blastocatellia bacterium]|nr:hypothetical protein [Blastocatellia bacterium]